MKGEQRTQVDKSETIHEASYR